MSEQERGILWERLDWVVCVSSIQLTLWLLSSGGANSSYTCSYPHAFFSLIFPPRVQSDAYLTDVLRRGDFAAFASVVQALCEFYGLAAEQEKRDLLYSVRTSLYTDLTSLCAQERCVRMGAMSGGNPTSCREEGRLRSARA